MTTHRFVLVLKWNRRVALTLALAVTLPILAVTGLLTALAAHPGADITSGTLADVRLSGNVVLGGQQIALPKWYTAISTTQSTFAGGKSPIGVAFDGANIWVTNYFGGNVSVLRASDGFHVMTPTVGNNPQHMAFDGANMWVVNEGDTTVSVLRASDGFHVFTPTVGVLPLGIAFDGAFMWVVNYGNNNVSVLRASDGTHVFTPTVGASPRGIAFDGANLWVANFGDNTVTKLAGLPRLFLPLVSR